MKQMQISKCGMECAAAVLVTLSVAAVVFNSTRILLPLLVLVLVLVLLYAFSSSILCDARMYRQQQYL